MTKFTFIGLMTLVSVQVMGQAPPDAPDSIKKGIAEGKYKFTPIEKSAMYPGGVQEFYRYVGKNLKYPKRAKKNKLKGKVYVEFEVNQDGSINDQSLRVVPYEELSKMSGSLRLDVISDKDCEQEALRLMRDCPDWQPALQQNKPVKQKMAIPIPFVL